MRIFASLFLFVAAGGAGCSHTPDPSGADYRIEPAYIIRNVRCEIGAAILSDYPPGHWIRKSDIAYGLTIRAEENNTLSSPFNFVWPISLGTASLGPSFGRESFRAGENIVNIAEGIEEAARDLDGPSTEWPCNQDIVLKSIRYPIIGTLGLREVVRKFVDVNNVSKVNGMKDGGFTQTLKFHLKWLGGVKPAFSIKIADGRERSGSSELKIDRKDVHELILKIAPPVKVTFVAPSKRGMQEGGPQDQLVPPNSRARLLDDIRAQQNTERLRDVFRDLVR